MCQQDTETVYKTALTGALKYKQDNRLKQHYNVKLSLARLCLKQATVGEVTV